jgi:hypothetical protein
LLERHRQVQNGLVGDRLALALDGRERLEAAGAVGMDPAVDRPAGDLDAPAVRSGVVAHGELAHEHAALADRELVVGRLAHKRVAEERELSLGLVHRSVAPFQLGRVTLTDHMGDG